nr:photosystem I subunit VIII [Zanthoxylum ailanthoides]ULF02602.1 photosystem I subunit VIII [Zanthoxylum ailanthoides]
MAMASLFLYLEKNKIF